MPRFLNSVLSIGTLLFLASAVYFELLKDNSAELYLQIYTMAAAASLDVVVLGGTGAIGRMQCSCSSFSSFAFFQLHLALSSYRSQCILSCLRFTSLLFSFSVCECVCFRFPLHQSLFRFSPVLFSPAPASFLCLRPLHRMIQHDNIVSTGLLRNHTQKSCALEHAHCAHM